LKLAFSIISGMMVCGLLLFGVKTVIPIRAESGDPAVGTDNTTQSLINLLPDIEKIYRDSLTMPFIKAESKITDQDIARFYRELLDTSGLVKSEDNPNPNP
jgi:hypothetical protein